MDDVRPCSQAVPFLGGFLYVHNYDMVIHADTCRMVVFPTPDTRWKEVDARIRRDDPAYLYGRSAHRYNPDGDWCWAPVPTWAFLRSATSDDYGLWRRIVEHAQDERDRRAHMDRLMSAALRDAGVHTPIRIDARCPCGALGRKDVPALQMHKHVILSVSARYGLYCERCARKLRTQCKRLDEAAANKRLIRNIEERIAREQRSIDNGAATQETR